MSCKMEDYKMEDYKITITVGGCCCRRCQQQLQNQSLLSASKLDFDHFDFNLNSVHLQLHNNNNSYHNHLTGEKGWGARSCCTTLIESLLWSM